MPVFLWKFEYRRRRLNFNYRIDKVIIITMEENSDIFLAGGDALGYLIELMHKNIPQNLFRAYHLVRTYLMTDF